jgi:hypothetical protein
MHTREQTPRAFVLAAPFILAMVCACAGGEDDCKTPPIDEIFPGATLVGAICHNPGGLATPTPRELYLHLRAPPDAKLAKSRLLPTPRRSAAGSDLNSMDCPLLATSDEAHRDYVRSVLKDHGMALPPTSATYTLWRTDVPVMVDGDFPATLVQQLRAGDDVWLLTEGCEPR